MRRRRDDGRKRRRERGVGDKEKKRATKEGGIKWHGQAGTATFRLLCVATMMMIMKRNRALSLSRSHSRSCPLIALVHLDVQSLVACPWWWL